MTDDSTPALASTKRRSRGVLLHVFARLAQRVYALILIAIVVWLTFLAFRYLVVSLMIEQPAPPQVIELPKRLDAQVFKTTQSAFAAVAATNHARSPLAHYHQLDGWFQPDRFNDCTRSGCHAPLPHTKRKEVRAFLNMHATSIHCGVCHAQTKARHVELVWYDLETGKACEPPALLRAYAWLTSQSVEQQPTFTRADQEHIVGLLRNATRASGNEPGLKAIAEHFTAVRASSEAFRSLIDVARTTLPRYFRGEYGAKLARRDAAGNPILEHPDSEAGIQKCVRREAELRGRSAGTQPAQPNPLQVAQPWRCVDCHRREGSRVDFAVVGYPPARLKRLTQPLVFKWIDNIAEGRPFYLPGFIDPDRREPQD